MATRPTLPYYAPAELLPAPLPTVAEIVASKQIISSEGQTRVVRMGEHYAVKFANRTSTQEGENMLFIQQSTSIPIPKVYAIFQEVFPGGYGVTFIVMEYIPGRILSRVWETLGVSEKQAIVSQLRRHMDNLRSIPSPGYYGGIWRQQVRDADFENKADNCNIWPEPEIAGPHETEEQFVDAMWRCLEKVTPAGELGAVARNRHLAYFRRKYHKVFKGHPSVFTHANFFPGNVMLRPDGSVVIIDWEHAGWYLSFWEYCGTMVLLDHETDWDDLACEVLDEYDAELGWFAHHRFGILRRW